MGAICIHRRWLRERDLHGCYIKVEREVLYMIMVLRRMLGHCLQHCGGKAGECILYYSLYNSNAADADGPPDMDSWSQRWIA